MRAILAIGFLASAAALSRGDDAADAAKKLEGTYAVVTGVVEGKKDHEKLKEITAVVVKGGKITVKTEKRDDEAAFTLDPARKPAEITLKPARGGETLPGIYEVKDTPDGLQLTLAFTHGGGRPKDFKGEDERGVVLVLLRKRGEK